MLLMTHVDDINAEQIPYLIEQLMEKGAGNVHVINAMTKKGRQEYILLIDTPETSVHKISNYLAAELGTLGIRRIHADHISFMTSIETMKVSLQDTKGNTVWGGTVNVKLVKDESGVPLTARVEYECLKTAAKTMERLDSGITFYELKQMIESKALQHFKNTGFQINIEPDDEQEQSRRKRMSIV
jgi:uncharacterized protein (DUF111 family)